MILLAFLLTAGIAPTLVGTEPCPTCVLINSTCFNSNYLFDLNAPFGRRVVIHKLGTLRSKNVLFYSFEPPFEDREYFKTAFVSLEDSNKTGLISSPQKLDFGAFDIDQDRNLIYLGGSDGIFILDANVELIRFYSSRGDTITNIFYKNNVYFTIDKGVVVKEGDYFKKYIEYVSVERFVINKANALVYLNNTGLFVSKGNNVHRLSKKPFFRGLTIDFNDNIYSWWLDGIYKVIVESVLHMSKMVRIAKFEGIGAIGFDMDNNMLITNEKELFRMVMVDSGCEKA